MAMAGPMIQNVSDTAFLVAQCRAIESARPDALFHDPLAARLAGEKGRAIFASFPTILQTGWSIAIRTVIIDDFIKSAVARGVGMVVNLGAGLDTRPYRLDLPSDMLWVEADYPDIIAFKNTQLAGEPARFGIERVALDLADVEARRSFFADLGRRGRRTLVLTEGVVPYLTEQHAAELADDLRQLSGAEGWIVDYFSPEAHAWRDRRWAKGGHMREAPFKFRPSDWFGFFEAHGWRSSEVRYLPEEGVRRGRALPLPRSLRLIYGLMRAVAPAGRRNAAQRFMGYVLLEPK
ncbi:MAG TPA: SAM-dependent methyltransferase [Polyangiaceae bacterium]|nr:SAM-dependent methyltransferase [Polyangiaceae bacterium]